MKAMKRERRTHNAQFKARVAQEAIQGVKTVQQLASEYQVQAVATAGCVPELLN